MLLCVADDKLVAASEGGRLRKLASVTKRLFAADVSHHPTSGNRWAIMAIHRGTMYVHICYVQPDSHKAGVPLLF